MAKSRLEIVFPNSKIDGLEASETTKLYFVKSLDRNSIIFSSVQSARSQRSTYTQNTSHFSRGVRFRRCTDSIKSIFFSFHSSHRFAFGHISACVSASVFVMLSLHLDFVRSQYIYIFFRFIIIFSLVICSPFRL